jgi:hypothetical protein
MQQDSLTVPVTVTVQQHAPHPGVQPPHSLPFTGAPIELLLLLGLVLSLVGVALVAVYRRRTTPARSTP